MKEEEEEEDKKKKKKKIIYMHICFVFCCTDYAGRFPIAEA